MEGGGEWKLIFKGDAQGDSREKSQSRRTWTVKLCASDSDEGELKYVEVC